MIRPRRAALIVLLVLIGVLGARRAAAGLAASNPIVVENQQPGSEDWRIPTAGDQVADDTNNQIKGYVAAPSVDVGGALTFFVTVNPAQPFTIAFFRMGWYDGAGGRLLLTTPDLNGVTQPACPVVDSATNLIACTWSASYTLHVPSDWTDGIYLAVLTSAGHYQNDVPFTVRNDARVAALLYQQPVNTYEAYNGWGGKSLYTYNSTDGQRAYKVSFDRPFDGDGSGDFFGWEIYLLQWLEQRGYDVTYTTDVDTQANPSRLLGARAVLIPGHSEYWTKEMYDAAQAARDAGVSLGFFGADAIYWQVRYEPSAAGVPNRVLVCYKTSEPPNPIDPIAATTPSLTTTQWRNAPVNRPEQALVGVQYTSQTGPGWDNTAPFVVANAGSWVYAGSGLANGTTIPGLVGYEADRLWPDYPLPAYVGQSYTLLSQSRFINTVGVGDVQNSSVYQAASGAWVFAAGTMSWSWALARPGYVNPGLQQATINVLGMLLNDQPAALATTGVSPNTGPAEGGTAVTISGRGFGASQDGSTVSFGGTPAGGYSSWSDTAIVAIAPAHAAGTVDITVTVDGQSSTTSAADQFAYRPAQAPSHYRSVVLADNPISYWRLDETSGTTAYDQQGANPGEYEGTPSLGAGGALTGDPDPAAGFDGGSQFVSVPYSADLNPPVFSIEAWVYPTGGSGSYRGVMASRHYPQGWVLYAGSGNVWEFWINDGGGMAVVAGGAVAMNAWTYLAATFDGATARLYVNGRLAGSATVGSYTPQSGYPLTLGQGAPGDGFWFPGALDEAAIYGAALSADQVQAHYAAGTAAQPPAISAASVDDATAAGSP